MILSISCEDLLNLDEGENIGENKSDSFCVLWKLMPNSKHILVLRFSAMGDVAMTVPVLRAFTEQYPDVKITVVTRAFFKPMFKGLRNTEIYVPVKICF